MKLVSTAVSLLLFSQRILAADCWDYVGGDQYSKIESVVTNQLYWVREVLAYNCDNRANSICINQGPFLVLGKENKRFWVYGASNLVPDQQTWWDISEQIIQQCVYKNVWVAQTGGDYNYDNWKGTIGSWYTNSFEKRSEVPAFGNVTLANGDVLSLGRYIGSDENGVYTGFDILKNGTHVPFDVVVPDTFKFIRDFTGAQN